MVFHLVILLISLIAVTQKTSVSLLTVVSVRMLSWVGMLSCVCGVVHVLFYPLVARLIR